MKEATLQKKVEEVEILTKKFHDAKSIVFVDFLGLTVAEVSELRKSLYAQGCHLYVTKNNILRRAAKQAGYQGLDDILVGPSAVALSHDATAAAKIIFSFAKNNDKLGVKVGVVEGKVMNTADLKVVSNLPNKNGMISMLLSVLQAPIRNLGVAIKAVAEQRA
ncbi:MAG TPA: 50S ribosomal protein L10 [Bacilli bacterium]|nr:MAG: 50S ribosomal protein L10 [Tenericutes bacterium ADurb.BinA124]HNZ51050.1 50S ribosomal protein L10 [Bacilli bacterium]HOH18399.1 50S ribosomal protein L10 [Bacilli bacterium]HPX84095.1 50S ribosomal protein L10 [Bacilli bacterium]HQC74337.1 50S ribosomal protein L10 [Bacilli bacterium]